MPQGNNQFITIVGLILLGIICRGVVVLVFISWCGDLLKVSFAEALAGDLLGLELIFR